MRLSRPTRAAGRECPFDSSPARPMTVAVAPIRSCSRWGLPCRPCYQRRGALLPHRFALTRGTGLLTPADLARAVCFLWHFPWGRPRRRLAGIVFPWSPDFPLPANRFVGSGRPAVWLAKVCSRAPPGSSFASALRVPVKRPPTIVCGKCEGLAPRSAQAEPSDAGTFASETIGRRRRPSSGLGACGKLRLPGPSARRNFRRQARSMIPPPRTRSPW